MMLTFVALVEEGSYTAAADKLGASKSVVSNRVQRLETEIGVRLVNRTTRSISITDSGRHYYQKCLEILDQITALERGLVERDVAVSGELRVSVPQTVGVHYVVPICNDFISQNRAVRLNIELSDKHIDLVEGNFDVGIRIGRLEDSNLIARTAGHLRVVLVASPAYLETEGVPQHPEAISELDCIYDTNKRGGARWEFQCGAAVKKVNVNRRLSVNSASAVRVAALKGIGVGRVFEFLVRNDIRTGRLVEVLPESARYEIPVQVVYPHRPLMPARTRAFVDYFSAQLSAALRDDAEPSFQLLANGG